MLAYHNRREGYKTTLVHQDTEIIVIHVKYNLLNGNCPDGGHFWVIKGMIT